MTFQTTWFLLIAVLWVGYFILEGFDFGVGLDDGLVGLGVSLRRGGGGSGGRGRGFDRGGRGRGFLLGGQGGQREGGQGKASGERQQSHHSRETLRLRAPRTTAALG